MKRLFTSTEEWSQGAVPRDFLTPEDCLPVEIPPPLDPPGCFEWTVTSNNYGALPRTWAGETESGNLYFGFFKTVTFTPDPVWTDLWSALTEDQQNQLYELGCYCDDEGIDTPVIIVGPPTFPPVNALPFFWIPPAAGAGTFTGVREENPVDQVPGTCCPDNSKPKLELELTPKGEVQARLQIPKKVPQRFWSTYNNADALMQNGFPRFCCFVDECGEEVEGFIHYPRWLENEYDPYDPVEPQEPVGAIPIVNDVVWNPVNGLLGIPLSYATFHGGILHEFKPNLTDHVSEDLSPGLYAWEDPKVSGVDLEYNKDWFGDDLIEINKVGDVCADQCEELQETDCLTSCDADKFANYTLSGEFAAVAADEEAAVDAALAAAKAAAPGLCSDHIVELCYSRKQTLAQGNQFEARAAVYCRNEE